MKKFICLFFIALTLIGCNGSGSSSSTEEQKKETVNLQEIDLSGTWLVILEEDAFNNENDDHLLTNFQESRMIFNDTDSGIEFNRCERHGHSRPDTGVKADDRLYLRLDNNGYEYINGEFIRTWEEDDYYYEHISWQKTERLVKLSNEIQLDSGFFSLSGPVQISEENHVCVRSYYSTLSTDKSFTILIPTADDIIDFHINYWGDIDTKTYEFDNENYDNQIQGISLGDNEETFYNATGEYYPYITNGTVTFTDTSDASISGNFTATSQEGHEYSGSFEAIF